MPNARENLKSSTMFKALIAFVVALVTSIAVYFYCGYEHRSVSARVSPFASLGPGKVFGKSEADRGNFILTNYPTFEMYALYSAVACSLGVMVTGLMWRDKRRKETAEAE